MTNIIIVPQEYETANHRNLWLEMAKLTKDEVIVCNVSADYVVSFIRRKTWRIKDAKRNPVSFGNLLLFRPLFPVRPEILPISLQKCMGYKFWSNIKRIAPEVMSQDVRLLCYDAMWVNMLSGTHPKMKMAYYIFDEVRLHGRNGEIRKKASRLDMEACKKADAILTMTQDIADNRKEYSNKTIVIGNGSILPYKNTSPEIKFRKSVAFIGNFRSWIDEELLSKLVKKRRDLLFVIAGPVENDMRTFFDNLLNTNENVVYYGKVEKEKMPQLYMMFDCVIIPYKNNSFIKATRPIKIVESVLSGTPVVTVPVNGYEQSSFIRYATTVDEFSRELDYLMEHPIDGDNVEYKEFVNNNTWSAKAKVIMNALG